jgi:hypothetical protein
MRALNRIPLPPARRDGIGHLVRASEGSHPGFHRLTEDIPMTLRIPLMFAVVATLGAGLAFAKPGHDGERLKAIDTNGDGKVQVTEVESHAAKTATEIDANRDGRIEVAEVKAWREARRAERAQRRLLRLDANGDGSVSVEEFATARAEHATKRDVDGDGVIAADEMRPMRHRMHRRGPHAADE